MLPGAQTISVSSWCRWQDRGGWTLAKRYAPVGVVCQPLRTNRKYETMAYTVLLHLANGVPVMGEIEELPKPTDTLLTVLKPRQRDGKDLPYLGQDILKAIWPIDRLTVIEILKSVSEEKNIGFVRE